MPETSIIIRTLNEEKHLGNLLRAIAEQEYKDYEIIVVDSGSTDRSIEIAEKHNAKIISIESRDFTFGYALNIGAKAAAGKYLVTASAHVLPLDNRWLTNIIAPLKENPKLAEVYGRQAGHPTSKFSEKMDFIRIFKLEPIDSSVPIDYVNHANAAVRKDLWEQYPFDEYLFGLEDVAWSKLITEKGYLIRYEPEAPVYHIHEEKWPQVYNRYRREAIAALRIGLPHPPQGRTSLFGFISNLILDYIASFPSYSGGRFEEILRFRWYQWKGSRQGWLFDQNVNLEKERFNILFPSFNKAVVIRAPHEAAIEDTSLPEMKPGDVLVRVAYVGICRTDVEVYEGTLGYYTSGLAKYPIVPGHEYSGTVVKVGANNRFQERIKPGMKVIGEVMISKKEKGRREIGVVNHNGAYAEYVVVPGDLIHKVPENLDLKTAVLAEPLAVVTRGLERIKHKLLPQSKIAVIGAGPIGNLAVQSLFTQGHKVSVFDKRKERLEILENKIEKGSLKLEGLDRYDIIIEATGSREALEEILKHSNVDSTILLLGFPYGEISFNFEDLVAREKHVIGSVGAGWDEFKKALELLPELDTEPLTKMVLPIEEYKKAWHMLESGDYLKIILAPNPLEESERKESI